MRRMKTAVIGCGVISDVYLQSIRENFRILDVCACADLNEERMRATAEKYGLRAMSFEEILNEKEIELVLNLTNPGAHYALTKQALMHKKHVYSEKMLAVELAQGEELCALAKEYGVRLGCAPDTFLGGGLQTARYALEHGMAGQIRSGVVSLTRDFRVLGENLPHLYKKGGSVIYDMGSYYLTALCSLLGNVRCVTAFGAKTEETHHVGRVGSAHFGEKITLEGCNVITALLQFAGGALVTLHLNSDTIINETFHLELYGEQGILRMGDPNTFGGAVTLEKAKNAPVTLPFTHGFQAQSRGLGAAELAWSVMAGRPHRAGMDLACHVLEIVHGITQSIESGQIYRLHTEFKQPQPLPEGYIGAGFWEAVEESALV